MDRSDYLLSTSKTVEADGVDGNYDDEGELKWMGVKNRVDPHTIKEDEYARDVGWVSAHLLYRTLVHTFSNRGCLPSLFPLLCDELFITVDVYILFNS